MNQGQDGSLATGSRADSAACGNVHIYVHKRQIRKLNSISKFYVRIYYFVLGRRLLYWSYVTQCFAVYPIWRQNYVCKIQRYAKQCVIVCICFYPKIMVILFLVHSHLFIQESNILYLNIHYFAQDKQHENDCKIKILRLQLAILKVAVCNKYREIRKYPGSKT